MVFWHWLVLAAIFAIIEITAPAMVCLWLAAAAAGVALIAWVVPGLGWEAEALIFAALSILGILVGRVVFVRARPTAGEPNLNRRAESYIGRIFTLDQAIADGRGRLKVDDTVWRVEGPDLPPGTRVRITGADNTQLRVEPV